MIILFLVNVFLVEVCVLDNIFFEEIFIFVFINEWKYKCFKFYVLKYMSDDNNYVNVFYFKFIICVIKFLMLLKIYNCVNLRICSKF